MVSRSSTPLPSLPPTVTRSPPAIREAARLRQIADVFPYGTNTSRSMDLDHTRPYRPMNRGGPPGQTCMNNLGPESPRSPSGEDPRRLGRTTTRSRHHVHRTPLDTSSWSPTKAPSGSETRRTRTPSGAAPHLPMLERTAPGLTRELNPATPRTAVRTRRSRPCRSASGASASRDRGRPVRRTRRCAPGRLGGAARSGGSKSIPVTSAMAVMISRTETPSPLPRLYTGSSACRPPAPGPPPHGTGRGRRRGCSRARRCRPGSGSRRR